MSRRTARIVLAVYLLVLYVTLGLVRSITNYLRDTGVLRVSVLAAFVIAGSAMLWLIFRDRRNRNRQVVGMLALTLAAYAAVILPMESAEEKIHFIEYGIVALLADASAPAGWSGKKRFFLCALFVLAAGWIDELIQALLPNRVYDLRDVAFNATAGVIALLALAAVRFSARETPAPAP